MHKDLDSGVIVGVLQLMRSASTKRKLLDNIYGPAAANIRASVASALHGRTLTKSAKEAQYGRLRLCLIEAVGAAGDCIAAVDADFEAKAEAKLIGGATCS